MNRSPGETVNGMLRILMPFHQDMLHDFRCNEVELTEPCCCSASVAGPGTVSHTAAVQCTVLRKKKSYTSYTNHLEHTEWQLKVALGDRDTNLPQWSALEISLW